jgi:hypothetical protein
MDKDDKGKEGGSCNIQSCQVSGAHYYNWGNMAYYCFRCARMLNYENGDVDGKGVLCPTAQDNEFIRSKES